MTKTFSHVVRLPIMTDLPEMIGAYRTLFESMRINCDCLHPMFPASEGFTHPIANENQVLLADFMSSMQLLQTAVLSYGSVTLNNVRTTQSHVTFLFSYEE